MPDNPNNKFDLLFWGDYALFTNPLTAITGSKYSYSVPTVSAVKGMLKAIYWKPSIEWEVDSIEILNQIQRETKNVLLAADYYRGTQRGTNTYLKDVAYRIKAHIVASDYKRQFAQDQQNGLVKHVKIAHSRFSRGSGYKVPNMGVSECRAFVREIEPSENINGFYQNKDVFVDMMLLDIVYPTSSDKPAYRVFYMPDVSGGIIHPPKTKDIVSQYKMNQLGSSYVVEEIQPDEYTLQFPEWTDSEEPVMKDV